MSNNNFSKRLTSLRFTSGSRGSTLILAILVMITLSASVYVIARISVRTVRQGAATLSGATALLVADIGTEQGLWRHGRIVGDPGDCDNFANSNPGPGQIKIGNSIYALGATGQPNYAVQYCRSGLRDPQTTLVLNPSETKEIFIMDPFNLTQDPGYTRIDFSGVAGSGTVTLTDWDTPNFVSFPLSTGGSNFFTLSPNLKYILTIAADPAGLTVDIVSQPKGLLGDSVTVRSIAQDPGVSRMWEVTGMGF